jgi:Na+/H+ antiporter NhaA
MKIARSRPLSAVRAFLRSESAGGLLLMGSAALALVVANSPLADGYFHALHIYVGGLSVGHWVNDGLMAVFFLLVGLEIKRETVDGELSTWSRRVLPGVAALGGMVAGLSIVTRTELLLVVIGGVFVVELLSVAVQIAVFRTARRRVFRMAPFHHHFELAGWAETTVIIRFWLLAAMCAALGLGLFYQEWLTASVGQ